MPDRRQILTAALVAGALGVPALAAPPLVPPALSAEDQALVTRAISYLQALTSGEARFTQRDGRGQSSQGTLHLQRPGKARFAYDPPSGLVVVSDGHVVTVADKRLKTFDRYPLGATPLSLFLAKTIRFDRGVQVTRVNRLPGAFELVARDITKKTAGELTLTFSDTPLALAGWTVSDAQGRSTQVRLSGLQRTGPLDPSLFVLKDARMAAPGRAKM